VCVCARARAHTDVAKYISMCVWVCVCVMKTVNYLKLNVGMSEQYLVRHCYNTSKIRCSSVFRKN
jgi:hypothetical protein